MEGWVDRGVSNLKDLSCLSLWIMSSLLYLSFFLSFSFSLSRCIVFTPRRIRSTASLPHLILQCPPVVNTFLSSPYSIHSSSSAPIHGFCQHTCHPPSYSTCSRFRLDGRPNQLHVVDGYHCPTVRFVAADDDRKNRIQKQEARLLLRKPIVLYTTH